MKIPKTVKLENNPALLAVAEPVQSSQCAELARALDQALRRSGYPAGIALPQLGVALKGFVISGHIAVQGPRRHRYCFNSEFFFDELSGTTLQAEECLSLPGKTYYVSRYVRIMADYMNEDGQHIQEELHGRLARVYAHEHDHTQGILISDPRRAKMPKLDVNMQPVKARLAADEITQRIIASQSS